MDERRQELPGDLSLPFHARWRLKRVQIASAMDYFGLVVILVSANRFSTFDPPISTAGKAHLWTYGLACSACILWRIVSGAKMESSYVRHMEVASAFFRLASYGFGAAWGLQKRFMDAAAPLSEPPENAALSPDRCLRQVVQLLFASACLNMLQLSLCRPMRLRWSIVMQGLLLYHCTRYTGLMCSTQPFTTHSAQRITHTMYQTFSSLDYFSAYPVSYSLGLSPEALLECQALMRFFQVTIGFLLPLAWQAVAESSLFHAHQRQRVAAGLPPEGGLDAALLRAVRELSDVGLRPQLVVALWVLIWVCWEAVMSIGLR